MRNTPAQLFYSNNFKKFQGSYFYEDHRAIASGKWASIVYCIFTDSEIQFIYTSMSILPQLYLYLFNNFTVKKNGTY